MVEHHLIEKGIQPSYTIWSYHGELFPTTNDPNEDENDGQGDEMQDLLTDITGITGPSHGIDQELDDIPEIEIDQESYKFSDLFIEMEKEMYP
ncbi:hypothetical protein PanWU01x14_334170, partial [Parasponia andersonii]